MRISFVNTLIRVAEQDKRIYLLSGDLGFTVFEEFQKRFTRRFFNVGVAEQNMIGIASGLALSGKVVFLYSIAPFITFRPFEQVRDDVCYHNLNVKIVGVGWGYAYGSLGSTHHALEDIALMKSLPHMSVICPSDPIETELAVKAVTKLRGPCYLRLGKMGESVIHHSPVSFRVGAGITVRRGRDGTVIATGTILENALIAAESLKEKNFHVRVISMHTVKPIDRTLIFKAARETRAICTIEEHSRIGGLGDSVASIIAESSHRGIPFCKIAAPDSFAHVIGSQAYLREKAGLSHEAIADTVAKFLKKEKKFAR